MVARLAEELRTLRDAIDEIREELQWANRNADDLPGHPLHSFRLRSMPTDPAAPDWAERVNAVPPEAIAAAATTNSPEPEPRVALSEPERPVLDAPRSSGRKGPGRLF
jgi:hypothetical protein